MTASLYVHIPFCVSKCAYCDFFSKSCGHCGVPDDYISALINEIKYKTLSLGIKKWDTVYIGGGTPSLLFPHQIVRLLSAVRPTAKADGAARDSDVVSDINVDEASDVPEVTIEANPADITVEFLDACKSAGVTRLSVGVQSLNETSLSFVSRRSDVRSIEKALSLIARQWSGVFSVDLIAGLPHETSESFMKGLTRVLQTQPHHISLYSLTVEEGTRLGEGIFSGAVTYDYDKADALWLSGRDALCEAGYSQYEVSNFCKSSFECRHNMAYWQQKNYVGVGAGATGTIYFDGGAVASSGAGEDGASVAPCGVLSGAVSSGDADCASYYARRVTNTTDIDFYIDFWRSADVSGGALAPNSVPDSVDTPRSLLATIQSVEMLDRATVQFEFFMMGLRTLRGISREKYIARFGCDFTEETISLFDDLANRGMAQITVRPASDVRCVVSSCSASASGDKGIEHFYALTQKGILFLNDVLLKIIV